MLLTYLGRFLVHVLRPQFTWCDSLAFLVGVSLPVITWLVDDAVIEFALDLVGWELLAGLGLILLVRAFAAPYLMWRELMVHVSQLHRELDGQERARHADS
jgi:hypothetical protein